MGTMHDIGITEIGVTEEHGFFKVPADLQEGFVLVPTPEGKLSLVFCNKARMKRFLSDYGFKPIVLGDKIKTMN